MPAVSRPAWMLALSGVAGQLGPAPFAGQIIATMGCT